MYYLVIIGNYYKAWEYFSTSIMGWDNGSYGENGI